MMSKLAILGAGSWGMTLACLACDKGKDVWLWDRSAEKIAALRKNPHVDFPLSLTLPDSLRLTASLAEAVHEADVILMVVTSGGTRTVAQAMRATGELSPKSVILNASKGIEYASLEPLSTVIAKELPDNPFAVLSGPTLAAEILKGLPTACSVACQNAGVAEYLQKFLFNQRLFRLYSNTDVLGVELGGSLKNIFAIASGYMQAKMLGDNARAALITRGLHEMTRFSVALGAMEKTLYGLSGLGDLLATCNSPLSRNYQAGYRLAKGERLEEILSDMKVVVEGVQTTRAVSILADKLQIEVPIVKTIELSFAGELSEDLMISNLMSRKLKSEE